jgi:hypothetical protein
LVSGVAIHPREALQGNIPELLPGEAAQREMAMAARAGWVPSTGNGWVLVFEEDALSDDLGAGGVGDRRPNDPWRIALAIALRGSKGRSWGASRGDNDCG